jgi:hypothetical protein
LLAKANRLIWPSDRGNLLADETFEGVEGRTEAGVPDESFGSAAFPADAESREVDPRLVLGLVS